MNGDDMNWVANEQNVLLLFNPFHRGRRQNVAFFS